MEMMVQNAWFKKVTLLLLLLSGSMNLSFSVAAATPGEEQQELFVSVEFGEQLHDIRDGSLPAVAGSHFHVLKYISTLPVYQFLSREEAERTAAYIQFCQEIDLALSISDIIYPFHSFL